MDMHVLLRPPPHLSRHCSHQIYLQYRGLLSHGLAGWDESVNLGAPASCEAKMSTSDRKYQGAYGRGLGLGEGPLLLSAER